MLDVDFWIKRDETADKVRMTIDEIHMFNDYNITKLARCGYLYDLAGFSGAYAYGICTKRAIMYESPHNTPLTAIYLGEPVIVLESCEEWYRVRCVYYEGWVKKDSIGICRSYEEWHSYRHMKHFLMVTGDMFGFNMGVKLALDMDCKQCLSDGYYFNYVVKLPVRNKNGFVEFTREYIPVSCDVCVGYMPYTGANVLKLAYKNLGRPYGWAGTNDSRDCSSLVMDIHRCFGITLPRDVKGQRRVSGCRCLRFDDEDDWEMLRAGDIIGWSDSDGAHTMIYLGFEKEYYCISAVGGKFGRCIINPVSMLRDNGMSWQESVGYGKLLRRKMAHAVIHAVRTEKVVENGWCQ